MAARPKSSGDAVEPPPPSGDRDRLLLERRSVLGKGVGLVIGGALAASATGGVAALLSRGGDVTYNGTFDVEFSASSATSAWHNARSGEKMRASDFPHPGLGAIGRIPELGINLIVSFMSPAEAAPTMRGLVPYGEGVFAAYNAKCKHLGCKAEWRSQAEAERLAPTVAIGRDLVVCGCHFSAYDTYDSAKVLKGPATQPLDQLRVKIAADGQVQIEFKDYRYDRFGRGRQV